MKQTLETYPGLSPVVMVDPGYQIQISEAPVDAEWDDFLAGTPGGYHTQLSSWGRFKGSLNRRAVRVIATQGDRIVGGAQMLIRPFSFMGGVVAVGYVPKGPVFALEDPALVAPVMDGLHQVSKANGVQCLIIQPPRDHEEFSQHLLQHGFRPSLISIGDTATVLVDLQGDLDEVFARMRKCARRYIRGGLRRGLTAREGTERDLPVFYRLMATTCQRQGFSLLPESYYAEMWRCLCPSGHIRLFMVEYQGEPVSAMIVIVLGNRILAKNKGWSGKYKNLGPNYVLDWSIMEWAHKEGYRYYDFEGIDSGVAEEVINNDLPAKAVTHGPTRYKMSFGGQVVLFPKAYEYIYNPLLRWGCGILLPRISEMPMLGKMIDRLRAG